MINTWPTKRKMMIIAVVVVIVAAVAMFLRFIAGGPEDTWICVDGAWVKHGNPSAPMPNTICE